RRGGVAAGGGPAARGYSPRRLAASGWRAARSAGRKPPTTPIAAANTRPATSAAGVMRNAKATSLKDWKLVVLVVMPLIGIAIRQPIAPPIKARKIDSIMNETITDHGLKPSTSRVAIS